MRAGRRATGLAAAILALWIAGPALAEPLWYQHYEKGLELVAGGDWQSALEHFERAAAQRPTPQARARTYGSQFLFVYDPLFQRARCLAALHRFSEAALQLRLAEQAGVSGNESLADLRVQIERGIAEETAPPSSGRTTGPPLARSPADSEPSATLQIDSTPAGAEVRVDGKALGATPLAPRPVTPGPHVVELRRSGFDAWRDEISPLPSELLHLDVTLRAALATADPAGVPVVVKSSLPVLVSGSLDPVAGATPEPNRGAIVAPPLDEPSLGVSPSPALASAAAAPGKDPISAGERGPVVGQGRWLPALALLLIACLAILILRRRWTSADRDLNGLGRRVGGYILLAELGRGGMATTYRARRHADGKEVALKIPYESGDPTFRARFLREGRLGETLHHPGIVRILEAGEDSETPFLAMELLPGHTLEEELRLHPNGLELGRALAMVRDVAEALDYAHTKGVIHRDLKPANIMLLPDGSLEVMDFGVARVLGQPGLTSSQHFFGSPLYAAPETIEPATVDHRADLYSLGVLLFELLQGKPPFVHESVFRVLEMHRQQPLPKARDLSPPLPEEVWQLICRLCAKQPEERPGSAQELLLDLRSLLHRPTPKATESPRPSLSHRP